MNEKEKPIQYDFYTINRFSTTTSNYTINIRSTINEEKSYEELCKKIIIQNRILKEYQLWANILVDIVKKQEIYNEHLDLGTPIQERLESNENLMNENLEIKKKIMEQMQTNIKLKNKIKIQKWSLNNLVKDYNSKESNSIKETNSILNKNLQQMANELDNLSELKMEIDLIIGNNDENNTSVDFLCNNSMNNKLITSKDNISQNQLLTSKDSIFSSKIFQKSNNLNDLKKIKELYLIRKNLIEENELLKKMINIFIPETIKESKEISCGCRGDIKKKEME